jgi:hypothetical protein
LKIHPALKESLGYEKDIPDKEFLRHWKKRSTAVCKPCWELKYCPYGPFVEQSPLLPVTRIEALEYHKRIQKYLESGIFGEERPLDEATKSYYTELLQIAKKNPSVLAAKVAHELNLQVLMTSDEERDIEEILSPPISDLHKYKVPMPLFEEAVPPIDITPELEIEIAKEIKRMEKAIRSGIDDNRKELDPAHKRFFENNLDEFNPADYPEVIPQLFKDLECNIFGHICPVVFVGESITETSERRRQGRYISFHTKMRVVRRDNYTCQECGKHLKDDEVEFDHIIPVSKGGSSEEHNIRLTCYNCNRDKLARVDL